MTNENYLIHYGVKGMKWGVRRKLSDVSSGIKRKISRKTSPEKQKENVDKTIDAAILTSGVISSAGTMAIVAPIVMNTIGRNSPAVSAGVTMTAGLLGGVGGIALSSLALENSRL